MQSRFLMFLFVVLFLASCSGGRDKTDAMSGSGDTGPSTIFPNGPMTDKKTTTKATTPTGTETQYQIAGNGGCRVSKKGSAISGALKIVFSSGYTVVINNPSVRVELSNGFIYRPGGGAYRGATWTSHGGIFIFRPPGDKSTYLTI